MLKIQIDESRFHNNSHTRDLPFTNFANHYITSLYTFSKSILSQIVNSTNAYAQRRREILHYQIVDLGSSSLARYHAVYQFPRPSKLINVLRIQKHVYARLQIICQSLDFDRYFDISIHL